MPKSKPSQGIFHWNGNTPLRGYSSITIQEFTITSTEGRNWDGLLHFFDSAQNRKRTCSFHVRYDGPKGWAVTNKSETTGKFDINSGVNEALTEFVVGQIDKYQRQAKEPATRQANTTETTPQPPLPEKPAPLVPEQGRDTITPRPETGGDDLTDKVLDVHPDKIVVFQPNPNDPRFSGQPRKHFNPRSLEKLAKSLKVHGQRTPVTVVLNGNGDFELVNGERRWRATKMAGLPTIKVIVREREDKKSQHLGALIENFNREGHTTLELSNALQEQVEAGNSPRELAEALSLNLSTIYHLLLLQSLHPDLKPLLDPPTPESNRIRKAEGLVLCRIPAQQQMAVWDKAKTEPTRRLVLLRIKEAAKPFLPQHARGLDPDQIVRRATRGFNNLSTSAIELASLASDDGLKHFATYRGRQGVEEAILTLEETARNVAELLARLRATQTTP